jgi:hypothetical protein
VTAKPHHLVVVVELGDELVALPLVLGLLELELEPLPLLPGPPIELVLPLLGDELLLVSLLLLLPLPLGLVLAVLGLLLVLLLLEPGLVLAVLGLVGEVLLDELVEPGVVPAPPAPDVLCLLQALSERAATTATVAAAH